GDIAWGGNWFYLVDWNRTALTLQNTETLSEEAWKIRKALNAQGHPDVDHVELVGPPAAPGSSARNFVLCPGKAYDRSPCGTGTSAKLACLAADGKLAEGAPWVQESILGSTFCASYRWLDRASGKVAPLITGRAYVNAESTLLIDERDPFAWGIR
ncbi:MAG: hydroxyproline-2-epimerase, partial [Burkholderiales bacterium]|nr:hydroxyproline-2-epimerase [Burkholderiales bacterium]